MNKLAATIGIIAAFGFASAASAADMPTKARVSAPVMGPNWVGFYVGGDVGARFASSRWTSLDFDTGGAPSVADNSPNLRKTSAYFGGYAGYNWMFAPAWLAGVEVSAGWAGGTSTQSPFPGSAVLGFVPGNDFVNVKLGWDATARGRLGYLVAPNWLVYGTGGVAFQQINAFANCIPGQFCVIAVSSSTDVTKAGWTAGGGLETMLWGNWIGRAQYLYADFGTISNRLPPAVLVGFHADIKVRTQTAVLGLAYKF